MKKQNLFLGVFATLLFLTAPASFAAEEEAEGGDTAAQGQRQDQEDRGPPPPPRGGHHGPRLSDAQRACLDGILGKPGRGERPSREKMDAAMQTCGVPKPPHGGRPPRPEEPSSAESQE